MTDDTKLKEECASKIAIHPFTDFAAISSSLGIVFNDSGTMIW
jgi:hypothetical protein